MKLVLDFESPSTFWGLWITYRLPVRLLLLWKRPIKKNSSSPLSHSFSQDSGCEIAETVEEEIDRRDKNGEYSRFSRDVTAAMLVYRAITKKVFLWELDAIIMQNLSDILPLTRPS